MNELDNVDYKTIGILLWHKGLAEALKFMASQTPNKIDDAVIAVVDEVADKIFPVPAEEVKPE